MVDVTAILPLNYSELDISLDRLGFFQSFNKTEDGRSATGFSEKLLTITFTAKGKDFAYENDPNHRPSGGTITEVDLSDSSTDYPLHYTLTGLDIHITGAPLNIFNSGATLFAGDDTFTGSSGYDGFRAYGGDDVLKGFGDVDRFDGGTGDDRLYGGLGNDILVGGADKDAFVFDTKLNAKTNVDTINDFTVADDTIWLDRNIFAKAGKVGKALPAKAFEKGTKADDKQDRIIYDKKTGDVFYDADGKKGDKQVLFAKLDEKLKLGADDFLVV